MSGLPLENEFRAFATSSEDVLTGALLVARLLDPATDQDWVREEIARLADLCAQDPIPESLVARLSDLGFRGAESYYERGNSSVEQVLRSRRGIPISLAVVVLSVAESCGLPARGINFPGHFLAQLGEVYVDPFAMRCLSARDLEALLSAQQQTPAAALQTAEPVAIVLRMLNNLRALAQTQGKPADALDISHYQMLLATDPLGLHIDRIDLWVAAGVPDMARFEIEAAARLTSDPDLRAWLEARREALGSAPNHLH